MKIKSYKTFIINEEVGWDLGNKTGQALKEMILKDGGSTELTLDKVKKALDAGFPVTTDNSILMRIACRQGANDVIKYLLDNGDVYDPNSENRHNIAMPLCWAAEVGHVETIKYLMSLGFNKLFMYPMAWCQHSRKMETSAICEMIDFLQEQVDSGKAQLLTGNPAVDDKKETDEKTGRVTQSLAEKLKSGQGEEKTFADAIKKKVSGRPPRREPTPPLKTIYK